MSDANGTSCPYRQLYIYYLEGRLPAAAELKLNNYIGNWEEDGFSFLFFTKPSWQQIEVLVNSTPGLKYLDSYDMTYEQWQGRAVEPLRVGRFHIRPPWRPAKERSANDPEQLPIILDPGVVFGTGTHATTRDCLKALDMAAGIHPLGSTLDLGTGTGLLALAAVGLGCRRCLAVDLNFLAAATAAANVRHNNCQSKIMVIRGRAEDFIGIDADLLIANIHYDIMNRLIGTRGFLGKKFFILSGLLRSEARAVIHHLSDVGVQILKEWSGDGIWHTYLGTSAH